MARVAGALGTPFMPWQRQVADVAMELLDDGRLAYREVRVTVPRQSGKTTLVLSLVIHRALGSPAQQIRYTAQTGADARKKWEDDWLPILDKSRFAPFYHARKTNGHEGLLFINGSLQGLLATKEESGHGGTLDLGISDEAFALPDARVEQAMVPAMQTRPMPQFWIPSTAGTPKKSAYLYRKVLSGRRMVEKGTNTGVCYFEWSAPDDADPMDRRTWWDCMPALGYTVTEDAVAAALQSMLDDEKLGLNEFERAYLNRWVVAMGDPILPLAKWQRLAREQAARPAWVVLGVDVAPHDASAAIVATGEVPEGLQSTVLESGDGVGWLLPGRDELGNDHPGALAETVERYGRPYVVVDGKACAHLLPEIERAVGFDRLRVLKDAEMTRACAFWLRLAQEGRSFHRGEPELEVALLGAGQRKLGDGWAWSRIKSGTDISPLVAMTLAESFWIGSWGGDE